MTNERRRARRPWIVLALLVAVGVPTLLVALRGFGGGAADSPNGAGGGVDDGSAATPAKDTTGPRDGPAPKSRDDGAINQGDGVPARRPEPVKRDRGGDHLSAAGTTPSAPPPNPSASTAPSPPPAPAPGDEVSPGAADRDIVVSPEPISKATALAQRDPLEARRQLTGLISDARLSPAEHAKAREAAGAINAAILFSTTILPGDPFARSYVVQSGDRLERIARSQGLDSDWRLLKRINGISDESKLRAGQTLKLVPGTFHAVVDKSDFRMDLLLGDGTQRIFVTSLPVGLGEYNSTPTGRFKVRPRSKLVDPAWTNPRTGEHHTSRDPKNPIGEHWIGIEGIDPGNAAIEGYGIHGTIDPASIGHQASMGCVRMKAADVALVYELLTEPNSTVTIVD